MSPRSLAAGCSHGQEGLLPSDPFLVESQALHSLLVSRYILENHSEPPEPAHPWNPGAGDAFVEAEIAVMSFEDRGRGFEPKKQATRS